MNTLRSKIREELVRNDSSMLANLLLSRYLNSSSEFVCISTLEDAELLYVTESFLRGIGREKHEVIGTTVFDLDLWVEPQNRERLVELLRKNAVVEDFEQMFRDRYGRIVTYILSAQIVTLLGVDCILTFGRDVSRKTSQEEFQRLQLAEELRQTVQAINTLVIKLKKRKDGQLVYTLAEGKIAHEVGYTTANSYGKTVEELFPGLMEREGAYYRQVLEGETISFETRLGERTLFKTLSPYWEQNKITGIIASAVDVTEQKKLERLLQASDINSALGQLAVGAAHEIRNPLTSIRGFVQLLGQMLQKNGLDKGQEYVDLILMELSRINHLVGEMLWLRKPKENQPRESFRLSALMADLLPLIQVEANLKSIQVITEFDASGLVLYGNPAHMKQVMLNLSKNAIEAMNEGGTLAISAHPQGEEIVISVRDNGPGIPENVRLQLFNPFFTTKPSGNGLGLFISRQIVGAWGGKLDLDSDATGTTARITLPVRSPDAGAD